MVSCPDNTCCILGALGDLYFVPSSILLLARYLGLANRGIRGVYGDTGHARESVCVVVCVCGFVSLCSVCVLVSIRGCQCRGTSHCSLAESNEAAVL